MADNCIIIPSNVGLTKKEVVLLASAFVRLCLPLSVCQSVCKSFFLHVCPSILMVINVSYPFYHLYLFTFREHNQTLKCNLAMY